jgi:hypothetical protein
VPGREKLVGRVATPPVRFAVPMTTPLLLKVTVPVGVPEEAWTVAVRMVLPLTRTGLTELVRVAVVVKRTTWVSVAVAFWVSWFEEV